MITFSLRDPDPEAVRQATGYTRAVTRVITVTYTHLRDSQNLESFQRAFDLAYPLRNRRMAAHQRVRVFAVLGMANAAVGAYPQALHWLDLALEDAAETPDLTDMLDLLVLHGAANRAVLHVGEAADDLRDCMELLSEAPPAPDPAVRRFELDVLAQLAGFEFYLAHYDQSEALLDRVQERARLVARFGDESHDHLTIATLQWQRALLHRWRRQPELALREATLAAATYTERGSPASAARIQRVAADAALDLADAVPGGSDYAAMVQLAEPHVRLARGLAHESRDEIGGGLARLTEVRASRMAWRNEDRVTAIEDVVALARRDRDRGLLAQAIIALGDELAARHEPESARAQYREALDVLRGTDMPALAVWAQRPLHTWDEYHVDS